MQHNRKDSTSLMQNSFNRSSATPVYATLSFRLPCDPECLFQSLKRDPCLCNLIINSIQFPVQMFQSLKRDPCLCNVSREAGSNEPVSLFQSLKRDPCLCNIAWSMCSCERLNCSFNRSSATPVYATFVLAPNVLSSVRVFQSLKRDPCLCNSALPPSVTQMARCFNRSSATPVYATLSTHLST